LNQSDIIADVIHCKYWRISHHNSKMVRISCKQVKRDKKEVTLGNKKEVTMV
jgi:hypothetical protein